MTSTRIASAIRESFTSVFDAGPERFLILAAAAAAVAADRSDDPGVPEVDDDL